MFNKLDGDFNDVAINTFKLGLLAEHGLRKSLTGKPIINVRQLMDKIHKYKRLKRISSKTREKARLSPKR